MTYRAGIIGTGGVAGMGIYSGSADDIGQPGHITGDNGYTSCHSFDGYKAEPFPLR